MENKTPLYLLILICLSGFVSAMKRCPDCGRTPVPFPLSTGSDCGDRLYKVRCNGGTLWFDTLNGSSYVVTSINQLNQRLIIRPPGLADNKTCMAADFRSQGIMLDDNLPFNITSSNTVIGMNCSSDVLQLSANCTSTSPCHDYIKRNVVANTTCGSLPFCCFYKTGGSNNAYRIRVRTERCSAYESFVNLDASLPVSKWPEPGVEIEWALPEEPICKSPVDCRDSANSVCLPNNGNRRCLCKTGYRWDPISGICQYLKCRNGRVCKKRKNQASLLIGALSVGAMAMGVVVTWLIVYKRRERSKREAQLSISKVREDILNANNSSGKSAKIFTGREITKATNNFSKQNLIGSGGFGEVFKGNLEDGTTIAVKRAKHGNIKGIDQIINEVRILCQVNHRSLVRLLGCCIELEQPLLIYEYIPNGNLFDRLHGNQKSSLLSWSDRLRIAHQTAEGLAYLHCSSVPRIYHRDIKTSNILLDEKLDAKVSDFGLSRLAVTETSHITTCAQGTLGYLDPEYYLNFQLTDKSDVYSFGVVLLELLSSEKAIDFNREEEDVNLVVYMKRVLREERLMDAIDPVIKDRASNVELESIKALGSLATACLDERRRNRPSMKQVADEIEYILSILSTTTEVSST